MKEAMRLRIGHYIVRAPHGDGRGGVFGNPPFNRHSFAALVSGRSARDCLWQSAALCGEMSCLLFGHPVQHHRHPSRSSAWFNAAQCAALELCDEEFASNFQSPFRCGALKVGFKEA